MSLTSVMYIAMAAIMILVLLLFVCFFVINWCRRNKESSNWVPSASIEHLRFDADDMLSNRVRTSTPHYGEMSSFQEFLRMQNDYMGHIYDPVIYASIPEPVVKPLNMPSKNLNSREILQTYINANEPKFVYWESIV